MFFKHIFVFVNFIAALRGSETQATEERNCTCVPYFQCSDDTGELIVDGSGLLDFRKYNKPECTGYFDVCCNVTKEIFKTTTESITENLQGCGYYTSGTFPWSGTLLHQQNPNQAFLYRCGFSLIHKQVGITAAHCLLKAGDNNFDQIERFSVIIGSLDKRGSHRRISEIVIHPSFNSATLQNDIALLFFVSPVSLTGATTLICIPPPRTLLGNTKCLATKRGNQRTLEVPIVPSESCEKALRWTRLGIFFQLHKSFLCAGGAKIDTCNGDGGSALVCPILGQFGRFHLVGIVSWGIGCKNDYPGVYVNVAMFREWIDEEMLKRGLDITSYRY